MKIIRIAYSCLFYLAIPIILLRLLYKSRRNAEYLNNIDERFGKISLDHENNIWVHAVSVGEVVATVPMIKRLQELFPNSHIVLTTMTPTGRERANALFDGNISIFYVPYDLPHCVQRFLDAVKPRAIVIMETEIWPNFMHYASNLKIPVLLANARLSPRSFRGYRRFKKSMSVLLKQYAYIAAQGRLDADRFIALGANPSSVVITGNMKFDQKIPASIHEKASLFQSLLGQNRLIWLAASTHEGEEEQILKAYAKIRKKLDQVLLVIVPRHPERFAKVANLCRKQGYNTVLRSDNMPCGNDTEVFIGDSMGELAAFYAACDVAYVGGSLVPTGGHNLLEPAALGIATLTGPHVFNFVEITELLEQAGAVKKINNSEQLAKEVCAWLHDSAVRTNVGDRGRKVVENNRGAVEKHLKLFASLIK